MEKEVVSVWLCFVITIPLGSTPILFCPLTFIFILGSLFKKDSEILIFKDNNSGVPTMMAIMTVDRNRNYYIATRGTSAPATVNRIRWQQPRHDKEADARREHIEFERPQAVETFHSFASKIDQHNGCRQEMLGLERSWKTHNWHIRCNMTILGVSIVDAWMVYQSATDEKGKQRNFYSSLATQLIDNDWDNSKGELFISSAGADNEEEDMIDFEENEHKKLLEKRSHGIGLHLTPVKDKNPNMGYTWQHRCRRAGCRRQVTLECSICYDLYCQNKGERFYCCRPTLSDHWNLHMEEFHGACLKTI